jgi:large subunit ribosomal protein L15
MDLSQLKPPRGQKHKNQRIGQGMGSGRGKFSGRGAKGAKSISGYSRMRGFEGGQMPLHRRLPKRGFTNIFRKEFAIINLGALNELEGDSFDPTSLLAIGAIRKIKDGLKVLGSGELKRKISIKAHLFSKSALEKIQAMGGTVEVLGGNKAPSRAVKPVKERIRKPRSAAPALESPQASAPNADGAEAGEPKKAKKEKSGDKAAGEKTSKPKQAKPSSKEEK